MLDTVACKDGGTLHHVILVAASGIEFFMAGQETPSVGPQGARPVCPTLLNSDSRELIYILNAFKRILSPWREYG